MSVVYIKVDNNYIKLIKFKTAKKKLHKSEATLYRYLNQNILERIKVGKSTFFREDELHELRKSEKIKRYGKKTRKENKNISDKSSTKRS